MAMSKIWALLVIVSFFFGLSTGRIGEVSNAALEGAGAAVTLAVSICGVMSLWTGIQEVMRACGLSAAIAAISRPFLSKLLPEAFRSPEAAGAVSANVSANLLGLGNAATPMGIRAARLMRTGDTASDELCRFVVLNTASIQLIPVTIAGVRAGLGARTPFDILPAVWFTSTLALSAGLLAARLFQGLSARSHKRRKP